MLFHRSIMRTLSNSIFNISCHHHYLHRTISSSNFMHLNFVGHIRYTISEHTQSYNVIPSLHHANLVKFHIQHFVSSPLSSSNNFIEQFHLNFVGHIRYTISEHTQSYNVIPSLHHANLMKFTSQF
jgi:hypothetical protein